MGDAQKHQHDKKSSPPNPPRKSDAGGGGLLSRLPFIKTSDGSKIRTDHDGEAPALPPGARAIATATQQQQQQKTRRRRGSLRKVALLGRGAQRERKDSSPLTVDTLTVDTLAASPSALEYADATTPKGTGQYDALGLHTADLTPRPAPAAKVSQTSFDTNSSVSSATSSPRAPEPRERESSTVYHSTTDEDETLHIPHVPDSLHPDRPISSGSDSYFTDRGSKQQRRRSFHQVKSPLSYSRLPTTSLHPPDSDWDYSETEWWGWVVLVVTWIVFVVGMGSCLDVWSWAWDVGKTPYAPPELEDDPTLPIVGYYPALIILTGVMAWVWVVIAWVGMKYFRHAKISGD
ncbi:hypothetical protein ACRE_028960 [Hapsidospora chrysogenum ATCC 11550]|uniref:Uncharacterized protein n=1 Tax=Hapsidospora chrysogenum (strain ATCC 11550 / CBS 779.69 / DSM 880 / IAM 14645 / JCM 23072 / IMI 49137) TaxID=857340 RepID=A0A086TA44_HAPC1|nr:hypothetical protein ACRE_028960 [Hapsidospora chrysogenum ATCC 11550]